MIDEYMLDHELDKVGDNEWRTYQCECGSFGCHEQFFIPWIMSLSLFHHAGYSFRVCNWLGEDEEVIMDLNGFKIVGVKDD